MCQCNPLIRSIYCSKCEPKTKLGNFGDILNEVCTKAALYDKLTFTAKEEPVQDAVIAAVRKDLLERSNIGIAKYGFTLADNQGGLRYWLQHGYEEALDMANYLKRAIMELDAKNGNE